MLTHPYSKLLFLCCLGWFLYRGPYRAIRYSTTGDFSTVYAAGRCWLHGANPYERTALQNELARAGAPVDIQRDQNVNVSVYLPSALVWIAPLAMVPWQVANPAWSLLSLALFAAALAELLRWSPLKTRGRFIVASLALVFSPTYVGLYDGNPGVAVIACLILAIGAALRNREWRCGLLFGIALCFKPQLALCAFLALVFWKKKRALTLGATIFAVSMLLGWVVVSQFGHNYQWLITEQQNVAVSFGVGGTSDPGPGSPVAWQLLNAQTIFSYILPDARAYNAAAWCVSISLLALFWFNWRRKRVRSPWQDAAFFAALTLTVSYHRYYDGQLLLLAIPLLCELANAHRRRSFAALLVCFVILAFPMQSVFARKLGTLAQQPSMSQFVLLRNQPAATLVLAVLLALPLA